MFDDLAVFKPEDFHDRFGLKLDVDMEHHKVTVGEDAFDIAAKSGELLFQVLQQRAKSLDPILAPGIVLDEMRPGVAPAAAAAVAAAAAKLNPKALRSVIIFLSFSAQQNCRAYGRRCAALIVTLAMTPPAQRQAARWLGRRSAISETEARLLSTTPPSTAVPRRSRSLMSGLSLGSLNR